MGQHLIAYRQNIGAGVSDINIDPIADPTVFISGKRVQVPDGMNLTHWQFWGAAGEIPDAVQLESPSTTARGGEYISYGSNALPLNSTFPQDVFFDSPLPLDVDEGLEIRVESNYGAAADTYVFVGLTDGDLARVTGEIITVRATSAITEVVGQWVNGNITFDRPLPTGQYQVVGLHAYGTQLLAARLFFKGSAWRPGVLASAVPAFTGMLSTRFGRGGVLGEFSSTNPPSIDVLGLGGTAQTYYLDLIRVG